MNLQGKALLILLTTGSFFPGRMPGDGHILRADGFGWSQNIAAFVDDDQLVFYGIF